MKVSFLITYYNQKKYVSSSIESVMRINKPCEWEILIGDDGSMDGTADIAQTYAMRDPEHIRLFVMDRNPNVVYDPIRRASANRMNLLSQSTGDFFCILDGDDYYTDVHFIGDAIEIFQKHNDVSVVAFGYQNDCGGELSEALTLPVEFNGKIVPKTQYLKYYYVPAGACVHKKCWGLDRLQYLNKIGYYDDNDIVINGLNYGDIYAICKPIYAYRQTNDSVYTGKASYEKALLNALGYDVDLQLIGKDFERNLFFRCGNAIFTLYKNRNRLKQLLPSDMYERYRKLTADLPGSVCYKLLNYDTLSHDEKMRITGKVFEFIIDKHSPVRKLTAKVGMASFPLCRNNQQK